MIAPTTNTVSQGRHGQYNAVDYRAKDRSENWNKTFYAPEDGKITAYGVSGNCGNRLELTAGSNRHGFCHLERSLVSVGQWVKKGQAIGVMGYTGYTIPSGVDGTHLHWVINRNGVYVYPPSLINEIGGEEMFQTKEEIFEAYLMLRGKLPTEAEWKAWIGKPKQSFFVIGRPEADGYRAQYASLEKNFYIVRDERDAARKQSAERLARIQTLEKELAIMTASRDRLQAELDAAKQAFGELEAQKQKEIDALNQVIQTKDEEIIRLTKELENAGTDCDKLTGWQLIVAGFNKIVGRK